MAPRPFPDESVRSWIGRVASRYDLEPPELVMRLQAGQAVHVSRLSSLDWREDVELERLLARTTRLDRVRIRALRLVMANRPESALWHRTLLAWCPACAREDIARHRETYERAVWRLGCCAACPTHRLVLADRCPMCAFGRVGFQAVAGRQRLVCALCKRPVDAAPDTRWDASTPDHHHFELARSPEWTDLALALQAVLVGVATGSAATGPCPWRFDVAADRVAVIVRDLATALLWPEWRGVGPIWTQDAITSVRDHVFAALAPRVSYKVLGIIASVLTAATGESPRAVSIEEFGPNGAAVDLAWFIRGLPPDEQRWLRARAEGWGSILARDVCDMVDIEEAGRRHAMVTREQARRDGAWVCQAALKYANDARRRIAARAARQKATALARKRNQASAMANGVP